MKAYAARSPWVFMPYSSGVYIRSRMPLVSAPMTILPLAV
jgi:hypothetical protein